MIRLFHVVTHPIQYFAPLYRALSTQSGIDLTVLFGSRHGLEPSFDVGFGKIIRFDVPLLDGYRYQFLTNKGSGEPNGHFGNFDCPELTHLIKPDRCDAVWIHGWGYRFHWQTIRAARTVQLPYFIRGETNLIVKPRYSLRWLTSRIRVGRMLQKTRQCLYIGRSNRDFYLSMGVNSAQLHPAHYSIDGLAFRNRIVSVDSESIRSQFGNTPDDYIVVCAAKAIPRKRIEDAIVAVSQSSPTVHLWILGDGPLRENLEALGKQIAPGRIHWHGFVNQSDIPMRFGAADVFLMPSEQEPWGLVVNEAMACGLPVVCSTGVGCAADLVREGETGFTYPVGNIQALTGILTKMQSNRESTQRMGRTAQKLIQEAYDVHVTAKQIAEAVKSTVKPGKG